VTHRQELGNVLGADSLFSESRIDRKRRNAVCGEQAAQSMVITNPVPGFSMCDLGQKGRR
jgi:hypothetical protein